MREWGFSDPAEAGRSKLEVGKDLMAIIAQEEKVTQFGISGGPQSYTQEFSGSSYNGGRWFKNATLSRTLKAWIGDWGLYIDIGARYETKGVQSDGKTWSQMDVTMRPISGSSLPLEEIELVRKLRDYLDGYKPAPVPAAPGV